MSSEAHGPEISRGVRFGGPGLVAAIALLTAYRFWLVDHSGITLFLDEAQYWDWARELAWGYYSKPPVIAWLLWLSTHVFGDGLLGVKAAGMLLYPLIALAVWGAGRSLFGPRAGAVAALAFITAPLAGLLGLFVSTDAPLLLCWTVATWAGWRALGPSRDRPATTAGQWAAWIALGLALGLGLLSKYTMAAIVPGLLWALWRWRGPARTASRDARTDVGRAAGAVVATVLAMALVAPHLAWNLGHGAPTLRHTMEITATAHRAGGLPALGEFIGGQLLILGPVASLALLLAAWRAWRARGAISQGPHDAAAAGARREPAAREATQYLLVLALPLLALAAAQALNAHAHLNWAAPAYVSAVLLLGAVLQSRPRWLWGSVLFNLAVVGLVTHAGDLARGAGRPVPAGWDAFVRMRGHDTAYARLRPVVAARPGWLVVSDDRSLLAQAAYQWRDLGVRPLAWNPQHRADNHYQLSTDLGARAGADVLFLSADALSPQVLARFGHVEEVQQTRVEVAPRRMVTVRLYALRGFLGYE